MEMDYLYGRKLMTMSHNYRPTPFCECFQRRTTPILRSNMRCCECGEVDYHEPEFTLVEAVSTPGASSVVESSDGDRQVIFHPVYSGGTALVWADRPLAGDRQYYWEIQMLTDTYGTDIMVGVGTRDVDYAEYQHRFASLLGLSHESYGLSYTGRVYHGGRMTHDTKGFCKGSLVGVAVDMWRGTLEFYINRKPLGVMFSNLHGRKSSLYPMASSTAAMSAMRLTYAGSRPVTLLAESAKTLATMVRHGSLKVPPGLWSQVRGRLWKPFPCEKSPIDANRQTDDAERSKVAPAVISDALQTQYINGYYADSVDREFRVVVRE